MVHDDDDDDDNDHEAYDMDNKLVVIGITVLDCISYVQKFPLAGETVIADYYKEDCGGKGANQAVQAGSLLGHSDVCLISKVGDDRIGNFLEHSIGDNRNVEMYVSQEPNCKTGRSSILVDSQGQNQIVVSPGQTRSLKNNVENAESLIRNSAVLVGQFESDLESTLQSFEWATKAIKIINTAPIPSLADPSIASLTDKILRKADIICGNEIEIRQLLGIHGGATDMSHDATYIRQMMQKYEKASVIMTRGKHGVILGEQQRIGGDTTPKISEIRGTGLRAVCSIGAGDAFVGALAAGMFLGHPLFKCSLLANRVAAYSVARRGTQSSYARRNDLQRLYSRCFTFKQR